MKTATASVLVLLLLSISACGNERAADDEGPAGAGSFAVLQIDFDNLRDNARDRDVPTTVYAPEAAGVYPYVLLSHGLGGDRKHYVYLARHLASHGYVVAVPEHIGSSSRQDAEDLLEALGSEDEICARKDDLVFLIDTASQWNVLTPGLQGKIDLEHIGVTGHSFGGGTSQWIGGARIRHGDGVKDISDPRVKAIVPMAGGGTTSPWFRENSFNHVQVPVMHIVGTDDGWLEKMSSYTNMPDGHKYYVALQNVDHLDFVDEKQRGGEKTERANIIIRALVTAFFDRYLKGEKSAEQKYLKPEYVRTLTTLQVPGVHWYEK